VKKKMNKKTKRMIVWLGMIGVTTLLASHLYACGMPGMGGGGSCGGHEEKQQHATTVEKVECAYCGMEMDKKEMKAKMKYKGEKLYFCTKKERSEFRKDPQAYLSGEKIGTCTMTMATTTTTTEPKAQYTCPMHPEVISDKSGKCPKCGMNLVKKK